jgi:hypothetical protein
MLQLFERDLTRRLIFAVLVAVAVGAMVVAIDNGRTSPTAIADREPAIDSLRPNQGADVLRQSTVGIQVAPGYMALLSINGIAIPEEQIGGDRNLGQYFFTPGAGQVIETLRGGENCALASYWRAAEGRDRSQTVQWCFSAT